MSVFDVGLITKSSYLDRLKFISHEKTVLDENIGLNMYILHVVLNCNYWKWFFTAL